MNDIQQWRSLFIDGVIQILESIKQQHRDEANYAMSSAYTTVIRDIQKRKEELVNHVSK